MKYLQHSETRDRWLKDLDSEKKSKTLVKTLIR